MGFSGDLGFDSDHQKKWVIAGIQLRAPLKPIYTVAEITDAKHGARDAEEEEEEQEECGSITPKAAEARIPARVTCPPPPRKRKPAAKKCTYGRVREFFTPPDLESVFIRHVET